jgi:hypothetical protein
MCLAEVHNGGFLQLFWNTTGVLVPEGIDGFNTIGMTTMAALLQRAASKLGAPYPRNRDDRWDALLIASGHGTKELKSIFDNQKNPYVAFAEATKRLGFDLLENEFWETAKTENGGFQKAATRYAQSPFLIQ